MDKTGYTKRQNRTETGRPLDMIAEKITDGRKNKRKLGQDTHLDS